MVSVYLFFSVGLAAYYLMRACVRAKQLVVYICHSSREVTFRSLDMHKHHMLYSHYFAPLMGKLLSIVLWYLQSYKVQGTESQESYKNCYNCPCCLCIKPWLVIKIIALRDCRRLKKGLKTYHCTLFLKNV